MMPRRVIVSIDRLVLRGFTPEQRIGIVQRLEAKLRQQIGAYAGQFDVGYSRSVVRARPIALPHAATPAQIGEIGGHALSRSILP